MPSPQGGPATAMKPSNSPKRRPLHQGWLQDPCRPQSMGCLCCSQLRVTAGKRGAEQPHAWIQAHTLEPVRGTPTHPSPWDSILCLLPPPTMRILSWGTYSLRAQSKTCPRWRWHWPPLPTSCPPPKCSPGCPQALQHGLLPCGAGCAWLIPAAMLRFLHPG